ncbi:PREDICTED: solute carrier organic anion transporter family member 1A1-like [Priapulus caudatus]|uniref:Solute carrier organic anion transporter family member 1A1-like n=1 Tax=Priapulus caudatus TaxID=37621 RepID=A0ABM1E0F7_PRICU|nr:PREDICTED: solute carrier organic anion transporter family member 1A1-like [Priapulus caudatus]
MAKYVWRTLQVYGGCACVGGAGLAVTGKCAPHCDAVLVRFLAILFTGTLLTAPLMLASLMSKMRCVRQDQKPLALGVVSLASSLFALMPGPVVAGMLVDTTCILWRSGKCEEDETGNCQLYDNDRLRYTIHGATAAVYVLAVFFYALAFKFAKGKCFGHVDEEDEAETVGAANSIAATYKTDVALVAMETKSLDGVSESNSENVRM